MISPHKAITDGCMSSDTAKALTQVREKIDALDDRIHDLLMERATLIREVSAIKRNSNRPIVHPAREASMIRRLLGRHKGLLPQAAVIGIWRELVGAVSMLQRGLQAHVSMEGNQNYCWDMAKDYCGSVIQMSRCPTSLMTLSAVRDDKDAIAVLPWPDDHHEKPWWELLITQDPAAQNVQLPMRIVAALPFGRQESFTALENRALVVGRMLYNPSGDDNSFVAFALESPLSRARAIDLLQEQGLEALSAISKSDAQTGKGSHLVEVKGYIAEDDPRLSAITEKLEDSQGRCVLVGGYPVPPILRAGDTDPVKLD